MKTDIIITTGDPNGIGPEVTLKALNSNKFDLNRIILISNKEVLNYYGSIPDVRLINIDFDPKNIQPSKITKEAGDFSFKCLEHACNLLKSGNYSALVTAPVAKEAMHMAGHNFSGQTEILEHFLARKNQKAEMLFVAKNFRVLLLTRHIALKQINLSKDEVVNKILNLVKYLKTKIKEPKIALCSLNPHAGEHGMFGDEEEKVLIPAVKDLRKLGIDITMPLPSDTLFVGVNYPNPPYDCYVACYHDQGLIPIKLIAQKETVNTTIGLDVIRTSPAHGTAFDIAGKGIASADSMIAAIEQVI